MLGNKIGFVGLGCPKATVDAEKIITKLKLNGYELSPTYVDADLVVINTCGFICEAIDESIEAITEAFESNGKVIVCGCLGKREEFILQQFPNILGITGPNDCEEVLALVKKHLPLDETDKDSWLGRVPPQGIKLTPQHYGYLKISEGCNHSCSFCVIPSFRGLLVSEKPELLLAEAQKLVESGTREIIVVSQDTAAYGTDIKDYSSMWNDGVVNASIDSLVDRLSELDVWVRLHYIYPYPVIDQLVELMAAGKVLPYLDVPFQHVNARILKLMKRPANGENNLQRIQRWRSICPEITIRSTFIVGFPGETEEEFEELLKFIAEADMERAGCFAYSPVDGAPANDLPDQIDEDEKQERVERFMLVQESISRAKLQKKIGQQIDVIVDDIIDGQAICRSKGDAPDIDGLVYIDNVVADEVAPGDIVTVTVIESDEHDLWGIL